MEAARELERVLDGIAETSPRGAHHVQATIRTTIDLLLEQPFSGRSTSLQPMRGITARPYPCLTFYVPTGTEIVIIGIRHGARDPTTMPDAR